MTISLGVIGCGRIGKIHIETIQNHLSQATVKIVADPFIDKAFLAQWSAIECTVDPAVIISDPTIEAVVICTPTHTHIELIKAALDAKKHVFCEKPVSHDPQAIAELIRVQSKIKCIVQIGFNRRFDPNFSTIRERVKDGWVGDIRLMNIKSYDPSPPGPDYIKNSGGMLNDMSIHDFDMVRYLSGQNVKSVYAQGANLVDPKIKELGDIDTATILLTLENNAIATIHNCRESSYGYDQRVEVFGSKGSLHADNETPTKTEYINSKGSHTDKPYHFFLERYAVSYQRELNDFLQAIRNQTPAPVGLKDIQAALLIAQAANQSVAGQCKITLKG